MVADILPGKGITRCNITACQCSLIRPARGNRPARFVGMWNIPMNAWYCFSHGRQINDYAKKGEEFVVMMDDPRAPTPPEIGDE